MTDQSVFILGSGLQTLEPAAFATEAEFQELLARHPRVLDFGALADGRPLRLVLVAREMGVATSTESGPAYRLDHLFVDADGVPTLVEVKRAGDTRIRREVVGQMLDYAANGARYWPAALLQRSFEDTCAADGRTVEEAYGELLGDRSPAEFWTAVEERLTAGRMRLLFVADRIPVELRAIVEFLNRQLRLTEVYAVELTQYRGDGDLRVLVPRIHGEVATAAKSPTGRSAGQRTTRAAFDAVMSTRLAPDARQVADRLLQHAQTHGRLEGGRGSYPSMLASYPVAGGQVRFWALSLYLSSPKEELAFSFGSISHHLGLDGAAAFADALPSLPALDKVLVAQREKGFTGWPSVPLAALLARPGAVEGILAAIQMAVQQAVQRVTRQVI